MNPLNPSLSAQLFSFSAPSPVTGFAFTNHAAAVLRERNIDPEWVRRTMITPERREPDPNDPAVERFFRIIPENDSRVLRVVVNTSTTPWRVVSVFFDRNMKGNL